MKKPIKVKARELHINSKIKKGKKVFYIVCYEYLGSSPAPKKTIQYPEFKKEFTSKSEAVAHARKSAKSIESRFNVRFALQFLNEK